MQKKCQDKQRWQEESHFFYGWWAWHIHPLIVTVLNLFKPLSLGVAERQPNPKSDSAARCSSAKVATIACYGPAKTLEIYSVAWDFHFPSSGQSPKPHNGASQACTSSFAAQEAWVGPLCSGSRGVSSALVPPTALPTLENVCFVTQVQVKSPMMHLIHWVPSLLRIKYVLDNGGIGRE